jgi:hypothetical protein
MSLAERCFCAQHGIAMKMKYGITSRANKCISTVATGVTSYLQDSFLHLKAPQACEVINQSMVAQWSNVLCVLRRGERVIEASFHHVGQLRAC